MDQDLERWCKELRRRRKALDLTQGEMADLMGVSRLTWYRWEAGEQPPTSRRMIELALWAIEQGATPAE